MKRIIAIVLIMILSLGSFNITEAAAIKISKKKITLEAGKSTTLKITGTKNKVKWSSSNKKVATVSANGKVVAKKLGVSTIKATVNKKNYKCMVTVLKSNNAKKDNNTDSENNNTTNNDNINTNYNDDYYHDTEEIEYTNGEDIDKEYVEREYPKEVLKLVNIEREKEGLLPLSDAGINLNESAKIRAKEISTSFSHTRPDGEGCFTVLYEMDVSYSWAGENIANGYETPEEVVNGWMNSEGHRRNIMSSNYSSLGVGVYYYNDTFYWVQLFIG